MTTTSGGAVPSTALTELSERQRQRAFDRYQTLRPHLEENVPLTRVAVAAELPLRTAQDWVSRYRRFGLAGLTRAGRADQGKRRRLSKELSHLAEGLALQRPPFGPGAIYREVKWHASKLVPRVYGDKTEVALTGRNGGPVQSVAVTVPVNDPIEAARVYQKVMGEG